MKKKTEKKQSTNLKKGDFTKEELKLYKLEDNEINTILEYQELLPVLQQDNGNWINSETLYSQLGVSKKTKFVDWIKQQLNDLEAELENEYFVSKRKTSDIKGGRPISDYFITVEIAKEIAMVSGAKGGRTGKELKERSKIARKYFIYIEKAFKNRVEWNSDRDSTMIKCKALKGALLKYGKEITREIPNYFHNNKFIAEFCLLNEVIIGMTASEYRRRKGYNKSYPIRNSFTEKELEYVHILEQYDADLIEVQNVFNYEKRKEYLDKKFKLMLR